MTKSISPDYLLAGNPETSAHELSRLAACCQPAHIRIRVAENPSTPVEALLDLAADKDVDIRVAVAGNPGAPSWLHALLARDDSPTVRFALAEDCYTSPEILAILLADENPYVQQAAQRTVDALELERALAEAGFLAEDGDEYKLGTLLTAANLLEEAQLAGLIQLAIDGGIPLGQTIVRMKALPKRTIAKALMLQSSLRRNELPVEEAVSRLCSTLNQLRGCA